MYKAITPPPTKKKDKYKQKDKISLIQKLRIFVWRKLVYAYPSFLRKVYRMDIGEGTRISWRANIDRSINPKGIHIGHNTAIVGETIILSHDACKGLKADTFIGDNCLIGARSIILPGVKIGSQVIIGAGSVVTKNVPSNCMAAGNPARIIKEYIKCGKYGRLQ